MDRIDFKSLIFSLLISVLIAIPAVISYENFIVAFNPNQLPEMRTDVEIQFKPSDLQFLDDLYQPGFAQIG